MNLKRIPSKENTMNENTDILHKLKWFNNPDNHKGTDTVAWIPRRVLAEAIAEIRDLRDEVNRKNNELSDVMWVS